MKIRIPSMVSALVLQGIISLDGRSYTTPAPCPECGGIPSGYDTRTRLFARIIEEDIPRDVMVHVKRFRCPGCMAISYAEAPFYPGTRLGAPVVDLCCVLSAQMSAYQAAKVMRELGIAIDPGTIRSHSTSDAGTIPIVELLGVRLPRSLLSLSLTGISPDEHIPVRRAEPGRTGGLPPAHGASLHRAFPPPERDKRDKKE